MEIAYQTTMETAAHSVSDGTQCSLLCDRRGRHLPRLLLQKTFQKGIEIDLGGFTATIKNKLSRGAPFVVLSQIKAMMKKMLH
mmetsp:Transcript_22556/g.32732  ORF Transcript_22556/g.32732 Transcript_22556/m.32732 type:complete len:83 (-) Transcript_22556:3977-4225(-)